MTVSQGLWVEGLNKVNSFLVRFREKPFHDLKEAIRAVTKALIGGGGGGSGYSYIRVLPDEFLLKSVVVTVDFKRNSSGRTRIYEYAHPPPPQLTL